MTAALAILALVWPAALMLTIGALQERFPSFALYLDRLLPPSDDRYDSDAVGSESRPRPHRNPEVTR